MSQDVSRPLLSGPRRALWAALALLFPLAVVLAPPVAEFLEHPAPAFSPKWFEAVGKGLALAGVGLFFVQYAIGAKLPLLDRAFSLNGTFLAHRWVALAAACMLSLHPLLLFAPKEREVGAIDLAAQWPLLLGALTLLSLWTAVAVALKRKFLGLPFQRWWGLHKIGVVALAVLAGTHAAFVHGHLHLGWPQAVLAGGLLIYLGSALARRGREYQVAAVEKAARDAFEVVLRPARGAAAPYAPGQFGLVTFLSENLPREEHPWTLASTPTRGEELRMCIRCSGDFTSAIGRLRPGDRALVKGPYGRFSYLRHGEEDGELVLVAGGVGVTPILSMLRHLADRGDQRPVTLIWSNRTEEDIILPRGMQELRERLSGLTIHYVLTRQPEYSGYSGRLDEAKYAAILKGVDRRAEVFVCGPPSLMADARRQLCRVGFSAGRIHTEEFAL
ncbi:ferredoxin reductase family protein [Desulfohalovibrio reitneri]|uniref:ferredoxin reductase family protein n=1 Tax=Desulfohalovibrio reitneri TaxID=1307759 RepID=UPI0004A6C544|nr:ferric reductase-like transmembrane domain-containing protein [Desulfohalovibrio reitneri]